MNNFIALYIPSRVLATASGMEHQIIKKDIINGILVAKNNEFVWYRDAIQYVFKKWEEGKTEMFDPYEIGVDNNIQSRILSLIDDEIGCHNISFIWNK